MCFKKRLILNGFTLAELIITLGVIGIVAAMTIPSLVTRINAVVTKNQLEVIEKRLVHGLNMYNNLENGLSGRSFNSTEEFLKGLSKYYKMSSICSADKLENCMPYKAISYEKFGAGSGVNSINVANLQNLSNLKLNSNEYLPPAGFVSAAGVPYIVALKKDCMEDPDQQLKGYTQCLDGIFDYNGARRPNKFGEDVKTLYSAKLNDCIYTINGVCVAVLPFTISSNEASEAASACKTSGRVTINGSEYTISNLFSCPYTGVNNGNYDVWLAAKIKCATQGLDLPTISELQNFAKGIYGLSTLPSNCFNGKPSYSRQCGVSPESAAGLQKSKTNYNFQLGIYWSNSLASYDSSGGTAEAWRFEEKYTRESTVTRNSGLPFAFCVGK